MSKSGRRTNRKTEPLSRSEVMRRVKGKDTTPEFVVRRLLHGLGYRYRLHRKDLPGKPDIVFSKKRAVIFVNGCYWHGHSCKRGDRLPRTNAEYWKAKISRNKERDARNEQNLKASGWRVMIVWECETKSLGELKGRFESFLGERNSGVVLRTATERD